MSGKRGVLKIVLDEITRKFLSELRQERKRLKISSKRASEYRGCCEGILFQYEMGRACPGLEVLMKLSELGVSLECVYAVLCILEREKELERIHRNVCRKR